MKAMPVAVRERIVRLYEEGRGTAEIAAFCGCCVAAVRRVRQQFKARGTLEPRTHRCGRKTLTNPERRARLQERIAQEPDATLAELGAALDRPFGPSTVDGWLRRLGLSRKKTLHAAEQDRPDVAEQRSRWPGELAALPVAPWTKAGPTPR